MKFIAGFGKNVLLSTSESSDQSRVALSLETAKHDTPKHIHIYKSTRRCVLEELILERQICPRDKWPTYNALRALKTFISDSLANC
jgi:hypothetical protein